MRETWAFSREPQPPGTVDVVGEHELHPNPHLSVPRADPGVWNTSTTSP